MMIEIIRRNVTSNMRVFIFTRYQSFYFRPHFLWVISAKCINIIKIGIFTLLDNTCYFIPKITVILPYFWIIALCSLGVYVVAFICRLPPALEEQFEECGWHYYKEPLRKKWYNHNNATRNYTACITKGCVVIIHTNLLASTWLFWQGPNIMMTSSSGNIFLFIGPLRGWPVNSSHKGQWRGALLFSLVCANGWINNRDAGD